ncbi:hypothetical protein BSI_37970 [Bacillus inaquosorum KCTC 13429]|uniref:Uncharacterized protein n=1 Tax=Bacillus inaquosorum KCTC 13429 TaxID=1236548 RepID=A0A9W5LFN0_9BACI|nr:hypothetical protein BSI_37970 [Bacillus inaquosorum KCTC 13429]
MFVSIIKEMINVGRLFQLKKELKSLKIKNLIFLFTNRG